MPTRVASLFSTAKYLSILLVAGFVLTSCQSRSFKVSSLSMLPTLHEDERILASMTHKAKFYDIVVYNSRALNGNSIFASRVCGAPGDTIEFKNGLLYRGGVMSDKPDHILPDSNDYENSYQQFPPFWGSTEQNRWTPKDFGPLVVPAKGQAITVTNENLRVYSGVLAKFKGVPSLSHDKLPYRHTFTHDYYFLVSDNRGHALDSRYHGFVSDSDLIGVMIQ